MKYVEYSQLNGSKLNHEYWVEIRPESKYWAEGEIYSHIHSGLFVTYGKLVDINTRFLFSILKRDFLLAFGLDRDNGEQFVKSNYGTYGKWRTKIDFKKHKVSILVFQKVDEIKRENPEPTQGKIFEKLDQRF